MKATMILTLIACCMLFGQAQAQTAPRSQPNWLRVGLRMESADEQVSDLFTRQLRKLGDVEVIRLLRDHYPLDSNEAHDVKLRVLVSTARRYAMAIVATHPADKDSQTRASSGDTELFAAAWIVVADEKDLESKCADVISQFDREVLEADRKRIRFLEPAHLENDAPTTIAPTVTVPPALSNEVEPPGGEVFRAGGGVTAPALLHTVEPEYSEEARKAKYQGTVILYVEVSPDGHAVNPRVVRSLGMGLDEKAIEAVRKWKFRPGYKDGKAVTVAVTIEVNFRLM